LPDAGTADIRAGQAHFNQEKIMDAHVYVALQYDPDPKAPLHLFMADYDEIRQVLTGITARSLCGSADSDSEPLDVLLLGAKNPALHAIEKRKNAPEQTLFCPQCLSALQSLPSWSIAP
jgi:hypothetical protein